MSDEMQKSITARKITLGIFATVFLLFVIAMVGIATADEQPIQKEHPEHGYYVDLERDIAYLKSGTKITLTAPPEWEIYWRYIKNGTKYPTEGDFTYQEEEWYLYDDETDIYFDEECSYILYYFGRRGEEYGPIEVQTYLVDDSPPSIYKEHPHHGFWGEMMYLGDIGWDKLGRFDGSTFYYDENLSGSCIYDFEVYRDELYASAYMGRLHKSRDGKTWVTVLDEYDGNMWELETFQGLLYMSYHNGELWASDGTTRGSLVYTAPDGIISMETDGVNLYFGTGGEAGACYDSELDGIANVYKYDGTSVTLISEDDEFGGGVQVLYIASDGFIYAGTSNPCAIYVYDGMEWVQLFSFEEDYAVLCITEYDDRLYAGTMSTSDPKDGIGRVYELDRVPILVGDNLDDQVSCLVVYKENLYAGTAWEGGRLYRYEGETSWTKVVDTDEWSGFRTSCIWGPEEDYLKVCAPIELTAEDQPAPPDESADIVLCLDRAGCMSAQKLEDFKSAAHHFVDAVLAHPNTRVAIVSFANEATIDVGLTTDAEALHDAIDNLVTSGGTNAEDGLAKSNELLSASTADEKIIKFISDGLPTTSNSGPPHDEAALEEAENSAELGIEIHTVGYGIESSSDAEDFMQELAIITGGRYHHAPTGNELDAVMVAQIGDIIGCASGIEDIFYGFWYEGKWYPKDKEDEYCGNYNITMFKHGKWWYTYTRPIHFKEECLHILEYWTKDNVCNQGELHQQSYFVDGTPPEVYKEHPEGYVEAPEKIAEIPVPWHCWDRFCQIGIRSIIVNGATEPVSVVREYASSTYEIPLDNLLWEDPLVTALDWTLIDDEPVEIEPGGSLTYDLFASPADSAMLVRYKVAWAYEPDEVITRFISEATLEHSPLRIKGNLCNFDVHNFLREFIDNFDLMLFGFLNPSDIVDWYDGWGTPPIISSILGGIEVVWIDTSDPIMSGETEHFGLHINPNKEIKGPEAYWTKIKPMIEVCAPIILTAEDKPFDSPCASDVEDIYYGFTCEGKWYPEDQQDEYCGNHNITMYKHGKWWYTYTRPIHFKEECTHVLEYWTKDNVCNQGPTYQQTYNVDSTPPTSDKEIGEPKYWDGNIWWVNLSTTLTIRATDKPFCGGIDYIHYEIWWDSDYDGTVDKKLVEKNAYGDEVTFTFDEECLHEIRWYAVDLMGHEEQMHCQQHMVDDTPPKTLCLYWVQGTTAIVQLTAKDPGRCAVGVSGIWYRKGYGSGAWSDWEFYDAASPFPLVLYLNVGRNGVRNLQYYAVDRLGNEEPVQEIEFGGGPPVLPIPPV